MKYVFGMVVVVASLLASGLEARPLLVVSGGFGSCAVAGYTSELKASDYIDELARSLDADLIKTCFALSNQTVFAEHLESGESFRGSIEDLFSFIVHYVRGPVYLVGQSYGGWVAMQASLKLPAKLKIKGLATIDPISMSTCAPTNFVGSVLLGSDPGCTQAPPDLSNRFRLIHQRVNQWHHFYQTEYSSLHSSHIPEATSSTMVEYGHSWHPFGAHALTETDEDIWEYIRLRFVRNR